MGEQGVQPDRAEQLRRGEARPNRAESASQPAAESSSRWGKVNPKVGYGVDMAMAINRYGHVDGIDTAMATRRHGHVDCVGMAMSFNRHGHVEWVGMAMSMASP